MFLKNSRYHKTETTKVDVGKDRKVSALKLRKLPDIKGSQQIVHGSDRLDIIAQQKYSDPTKFWHVADANSELEANDLIETGKVIEVPEN